MFHPVDHPLERGWVGRIDGDRVVQLAAQTLQSFFTGGGSAREHAEFPLADVRAPRARAAPAVDSPLRRAGSFAFANPAAVVGPGARSSTLGASDTCHEGAHARSAACRRDRRGRGDRRRSPSSRSGATRHGARRRTATSLSVSGRSSSPRTSSSRTGGRRDTRRRPRARDGAFPASTGAAVALAAAGRALRRRPPRRSRRAGRRGDRRRAAASSSRSTGSARSSSGSRADVQVVSTGTGRSPRSTALHLVLREFGDEEIYEAHESATRARR